MSQTAPRPSERVTGDLDKEAACGTSQPAPAAFDHLLFPRPQPGAPATATLRQRLARHGQDGPGQLGGRLFPIACIALEVTQRCNLDCTLCYLSDLAEATPDVPL
ncbi:MAG: hypothetical protein AAF908_01975, partial [Pseudomonadota bacterium]